MALSGRGVEAAFGWLGIPGGGTLREGFDAVGDWVSSGADWVGDRAEDVVDFLNLFD